MNHDAERPQCQARELPNLPITPCDRCETTTTGHRCTGACDPDTFDEILLRSLVAWLCWHAPSKATVERVPDDVRPLLAAMHTAKHYGAIARLAKRVATLRKEIP